MEDSTQSVSAAEGAAGRARMRDGERQRGGLGIDGVSAFMGMRWDDPQTVRLTIRPELINAGGLLSGVVTYALVDYCMGSTLWAQTSEQERIATINISINYVQTRTEGEIVCRTQLDRRNRSNAVMHSEVRDEDGRLLVTAIGSYAIFIPRAVREAAQAAAEAAGDSGAVREAAQAAAEAAGDSGAVRQAALAAAGDSGAVRSGDDA